VATKWLDFLKNNSLFFWVLNCVEIFTGSNLFEPELDYAELPQQLMLLLSHPRVLKVGRLVNGDLVYLQKACHSSEPFVPGIDLVKFAKDRRVVPTAQCSLQHTFVFRYFRSTQSLFPLCPQTVPSSQLRSSCFSVPSHPEKTQPC
jgi:hypothetical protein